ncbi:MAG TPA: hypothetical protein VHY09_11715 [Candidatus Methylacidiphilales bacterium]|jgi:hypothetical protein|nr:hypothetical protein [Candidatus Methylacidiphilales bacterium]
MSESLFQRKLESKPAATTTPHALIEKEIEHLKKRKTARYGDKPRQRASMWAFGIVMCALVGLYIMDPVLHAWYKGEAVHTYTYLHNFGTGKEADELATSGILRPEEIVTLNRGTATDKDYYATPQDAARAARTIINFMASVKALHYGRYEDLSFLGRVRYDLFIRTGLTPPTAWDFLDPGVGG